jgi:hypothetical protein
MKKICIYLILIILIICYFIIVIINLDKLFQLIGRRNYIDFWIVMLIDCWSQNWLHDTFC